MIVCAIRMILCLKIVAGWQKSRCRYFLTLFSRLLSKIVIGRKAGVWRKTENKGRGNEKATASRNVSFTHIVAVKGREHVVLWPVGEFEGKGNKPSFGQYLHTLFFGRMSSFQPPSSSSLFHTSYLVLFNNLDFASSTISLCFFLSSDVCLYFFLSLIGTLEKSFLFFGWLCRPILNRAFLISSCLDFPRVSRNVFRQPTISSSRSQAAHHHEQMGEEEEEEEEEGRIKPTSFWDLTDVRYLSSCLSVGITCNQTLFYSMP